MIVHCMKKSSWDEVKEKDSWGEDDIRKNGFIHCSTVEYLWRVLPGFKEDPDRRVLVCIDENRLHSMVKYEDSEDYPGRYYPHVYGLINNDAVIMVLDYLKDEDGHYRKNPEFADIADR